MTAEAWREIGDRVFTRRYAALDQQIGAILTDEGPIIVDTRSSAGEAHQIEADLRALTPLPVAAVVNTHHHFDHTLGNAAFRPAPIWGHVRCAEWLRRNGRADLEREAARLNPEAAAQLLATVIDPPDQTFGDDGATLEVGGRRLELRYLGRGHTGDDIVIVVADESVLFAGDLLENDATPYFGDGFPLDWPITAEALRPLATGAVVPGHGGVGDRAFVERSIAQLYSIAGLARRVHAGELSFNDALVASPYPAVEARQPIERALAQLNDELDEGS